VGACSVKERAMKALYRFTKNVTGAMDAVAAVTLGLMMALTVTDVVLRYLGHPFVGTYEVVAFGGAVAVAFGMPRTSLGYHNIAVEFLTDHVGVDTKRWFSLCTRPLSIAFFFLLGWGLTDKGIELYQSGEVTSGLQVIFYPIAFGMAFCAFAECLVLSYLLIHEFLTGKFGAEDDHGE
jgi:TRAP-type C4-dicarboxylate transport system permease small subunit